jgi:hypothetical protein
VTSRPEDRSFGLRGTMAPVRSVRIAALLGVVMVAAACTSASSAPTTTSTSVTATTSVATTATPAGWVPVAYGDAQVSVPSNWWYETGTPGLICPNNPIPGLVIVGPPHKTVATCARPAPAATVVSIGPLGAVPAPYRHEHPTILNGIPVILGSTTRGSRWLFVPSLHVVVQGSGSNARRVLDTLMRSPLELVLAHGPAPRVPGSWPWFSFAGVRFAAPPNLVLRTTDDTFETCPSVVPQLQSWVRAGHRVKRRARTPEETAHGRSDQTTRLVRLLTEGGMHDR